MLTSAWPATNAPTSFWQGPSFITVPATSARAAPRRAPPRKPRPLPSRFIGVACRFSEWFRPAFPGGKTFRGHRVLLAPGCLDRSLERIAAGDATFDLWLDHDHRQRLLDSASGCMSLRVSRDGERVYFRLRRTDDPDSRLAALVIAASGWRELSLGLTPTRFKVIGQSIFVFKAKVREVSVVEAGAVRRCWLKPRWN